MNKIAFFYSLWCDDNISKSIRYIVPFIKNVKQYNISKLHKKNIFIILHTDEFSLNIIQIIAKQENVSLNDIIIKIHHRNTYLRGMSWRFESFYNNDYDICINAEGDWSIEKYEKRLQLFEKEPKYCYILNSVRQFNLNPCCFAGGCIFIRPKMLSDDDKHKIKLCFDLILNLEHVHYGVDEYVYVKIAKRIFSKYKGLIIVDNTLRIFQHIENYEQEKQNLTPIFNTSDIIDIRSFNSKTKQYSNLIQKAEELKYKKGDSYFINSIEYKFGEPLRVDKNEFCDNDLLTIIDYILN